MQFLFDNYVLDTDRLELRRGSEPVAVEPQVFDLLVFMVQNRHGVVTKDDLIASVWGGRIVSELGNPDGSCGPTQMGGSYKSPAPAWRAIAAFS